MNQEDEQQFPVADEEDYSPTEVEIDSSEIPGDPSDSSVFEVIQEGENEPSPQDFDGNLAEDLMGSIGEDCVRVMALELLEAISEDETGREDWQSNYADHLKYMGLKEENVSLPWSNACGVTHPMLLEGITRFQSRASTKIFSQGGPVKIAVDAEMNQQVQVALVKAQRKVNYYFNNKMPEFRPETEKLLFSQAQIGVGFKKNYFNTRFGRVVSQFVKAENLILPYGCESIQTCERVTEIVRKTEAEIKSLQRSGVYLDTHLITTPEKMGEVEEEKSDATGVAPSGVLMEGVKLYECHVDLFIEEDQFSNPTGDPSPYIVTIDDNSQNILRIRRNWRQSDHLRIKRQVFTPYVYVPSDGPYGYGLVQLVGQLASVATKVIRQLVNAGTLASVQAWFKSEDARMSTQGPLAPGEMRDVELPPDQLASAFYPLPVKEPSQVLFTLLQMIVEKGEGFSSMGDLEISASSQNAPVGTTLALIERQTEISNAVQSRLYESLRIEFSLIKEIMQEFQPDVYGDIFGELEQLTGCECCLLPVGDPRSSTQSQRLILLQQVMQMAAQAPQIYDMAAVHRTILTDMGIDDVDVLIPDTSKIEPMDPMSETMAMLTSKPVKAFPEQNHQAHITFHQACKQDPYLAQMLAQNPRAQEIMASNEAHIAEHLALQLQQQVQARIGTMIQGPMNPQQASQVAGMMAQAVGQMVAEHTQQAQAQQNQQQAQNPEMILANKELAIKDQARQDKKDIAMARLQHDNDTKGAKTRLEVVRMASQAQQMEEANQTKLEIAGISDNTANNSLAVQAFKHLSDAYQNDLSGDNGQQ